MHNTSVRPYFPHLDGLRFFAFLIVFISHTVIFIWDDKLFLAQGDLGVSFFFVLSGFLITYLLYFEKESPRGYIKLKHFYARRILRIWPVYFMVILASIVLGALALKNLPFEVGIFKAVAWPWFTGFIANFYLIAFGGVSAVLAVLWSISVEEQFYFIWPLVVSYIKKRYILFFLCALILGSTVYRFIYAHNYNIVHYSTFSVISDLAIGALFGFLAFHTKNFAEYVKEFFTRRNTILLYALCLGFLYIKMFEPFPDSFNVIYIAISPLFFGILFASIILEQNYSERSLFKASKSNIINYLGKISYGLYAYHLVAMALIYSFFKSFNIYSPLIVSLISFGLTIIIAHISYKYIEQNILKLKNRF